MGNEIVLLGRILDYIIENEDKGITIKEIKDFVYCKNINKLPECLNFLLKWGFIKIINRNETNYYYLIKRNVERIHRIKDSID